MISPSARFFDTHAHLDCPPLGDRLPGELAAARRAGVGAFVVPGVRAAGWEALLTLARSEPGVWAAPGLHPQAAAEWSRETGARLRDLLQEPQVVAVGEIGLDGLLTSPELPLQEAVFRAQLQLAIGCGKPVLIHCRRADGRLLAMLREEGAQQVGGIWHAFSGSLETAQAAIKLNFVLGCGGPLTYANARRGPEVLRQLPPEAMVLETDAPDLAPHPHRGECNRPVYLTLVAQKVAEIRGWSLEETARITTANARRVLRMKDEG